jgi:flagellar FliL protein
VKKNLKFILPALLVVLGAGYKFVLATPAPAGPPPKIEGEVYVLPKEFLVNLHDGKFAKLGVGLVFHHGFTSAPPAGHGEPPAKPPEGFGVLPQEAIVRDIITDEITNSEAIELTAAKGRKKLKKHILERLEKETDVKVEDVLFTDVAVQ